MSKLQRACKQRPLREFSSRISLNQKEGGTRTVGVPDILYRRFELLERSLGQLPQFMGGFIVGVPLQDFQKVKQSTSCNSDATIFDALIGVDWETIKLSLDIHRQGIPDREQSIYPGDAEATKGFETFKGVNGYKYWIEPKGPDLPL